MNWYRLVERLKYFDRFSYAVAVVLKHEGGYCDDANDSGGATNFGISTKFLKENNLNYTAKDITESLAKSIYKKFWWQKYSYDRFKSLLIATKFFDCSVNCGNHEATLILQRAINNVSADKINVDGVLGDETFDLTNECNDTKLLDSIRVEMKQFYLNLINEHPEDYKFKTGWLARSEY